MWAQGTCHDIVVSPSNARFYVSFLCKSSHNIYRNFQPLNCSSSSFRNVRTKAVAVHFSCHSEASSIRLLLRKRLICANWLNWNPIQADTGRDGNLSEWVKVHQLILPLTRVWLGSGAAQFWWTSVASRSRNELIICKCHLIGSMNRRREKKCTPSWQSGEREHLYGQTERWNWNLTYIWLLLDLIQCNSQVYQWIVRNYSAAWSLC